jgi:hypothetical protein
MVRAAENIEFGNPRNVPNATTFAVQADAYTESDKATQFLAGTGEPNIHSDRYLVNFGESIKSFRQLFRRYNLASTSIIPNDTTDDLIIWKKLFTKMPGQFGYDAGGINSAKGLVATGTNFPFNFNTVSPLQFIMPAFVTYRGSTHYTWNIDAPLPIGTIRVYRTNGLNSSGATEATSVAVKGTASAAAAFYLSNSDLGSGGQSVNSQVTNAGVNIACPNYSIFRMQSTNPFNWTRPIIEDGSNRDMYTLEVALDGVTGVTPNGVRVYTYHAIGTDFGLYFFLNVPTYWIYGVPVAN